MDTRTYSVKCESCNALGINGVACHESGCTGHFIFTRRGKQYHQYKVYSLDVWGNSKEGYEVNDRSQRGSVMVPVDATDEQIIRALKDKDLLNKRCRFSSFSIDGDEFNVMVDWAKTSEPLYQLEIK